MVFFVEKSLFKVSFFTQNACDIDFVLSPHLMTAAITELWCIAKMLESTRGKLTRYDGLAIRKVQGENLIA